MTVRIATWNINSVRLRLPLLKKLVAHAEPDVICLQETKVEDASFPLADLKKLGFEHIHFAGQKSYNGVAILSKLPLKNQSAMDDIGGMPHKRHISAVLPDGTELHNFYVPAGGDIPDPALNPAFAHKLRFVEEMTAWAGKRKKKDHAIIVGDFNIAPLENDVWSHKQLLKIVSHTPAEVERLEALRATLNWCDAARHFTPPEHKLYSWWSYRNRDWRVSDRGRRLDHIWVTPPLTERLRAFDIVKDARDWAQDAAGPSDHVPVLVDIDL